MTYQSNSQSLARLCLLFLVGLPLAGTALAQDKAPAALRNNELKKLDAKATKVDELFVRNAFGIASEYEQAGDVARAVDYLHAMSLIKPGQPKIEEKLKQLRGEVLAANDFSFKHEPATDWGKPVAFVKAGKPFRIRSKGGYKLSISTVVGPDGFPEDNGQAELIEDAPLGKLVGVILEEGSQPGRKGKKKVVPFEIGAERVMTPRKNGYLYLKVNLPPQSKPSGSLQVQLSGYVLAPDGQNVGR